MPTDLAAQLLILALIGVLLLLFFLYVSTIEKVLVNVGFTRGEASTILFVTLFFGWLTIPLFPYEGWWVGISVGGALVPIALCVHLMRSRRVAVAEGFIGVIIVSVVTYFITRAEEGVGIVADAELAFAPALASGLYSVSTFWTDIRRAAPLAYFSGVLGTLVGADVFHLGEMLSYPAPEDGVVLSIGGANIFDMVYLTGIVAVAVAMIVLWIERKKRRLGFARVVDEFEKGAEGLPYAKDFQPAPKLTPDRKGRLGS